MDTALFCQLDSTLSRERVRTNISYRAVRDAYDPSGDPQVISLELQDELYRRSEGLEALRIGLWIELFHSVNPHILEPWRYGAWKETERKPEATIYMLTHARQGYAMLTVRKDGAFDIWLNDRELWAAARDAQITHGREADDIIGYKKGIPAGRLQALFDEVGLPSAGLEAELQ